MAHAAVASVVSKRRRPSRSCVGGLGDSKVKKAPSPMRWGPRWSQREGGPLAHAVRASVVPRRRRPSRPCVGASVVPKRRRPPGPRGGGLGDPKVKKAPSPMRWGPRWSQSEGGPLAHAVGALVVPKRRRPPRPRGGGLGGPKAKEALSPMRRGPPRPSGVPSPTGWGPWWCQSEGGPLAHVVGASVVPKRRRPPGPRVGGLGDPRV